MTTQSADLEVLAPETITDAPRPREVVASSVAPLLLFDAVSKWFGPVLGLNQVTLELRGGITGLVGANGAGKSELLSIEFFSSRRRHTR